MKKSQVGYFIIGSAIVFAFIIVLSAFYLKGTEVKDKITYLIFGGFMAFLLFVMGPLVLHIKKLREVDNKQIGELIDK